MKRSTATLLCFLAVCLTAPVASARRAVYAVAIGNNQPPAADAGLRPLRYADDDAVRFYELFSRFALRAELLAVLDSATQTRYPALASRTRAPTLSQLLATLRDFRPRMQEDVRRGDQPVLFLSFSGHGATEPSGEYALSFLDGGLTQGVLYDQILSGLEEVQVHLLVDACHAAGVVGVRGPFDRELEGETIKLEEAKRSALLERRSLSRFPNVGAIVATSSTEEAHEWSRIEAGVFTHEVISALFGAADVNGDHRIEYSEVQAFVAAANRGLPVNAAKPSVYSVPPAINQRAFLLDVMELHDTTLLQGIPKNLQHFHIETANGRRLLDAFLERPESAILALPRSAAALFIRDDEQEAKIPLGRIVRAAQLIFSPLTSESRGSVDSALRDGLFSNAYGPDYYRGYVDSQGLVPVEFALPGDPSKASQPPADRSALDRHHSKSKWPAVALAVTSGAAFVASAALGIAALKKRSELNEATYQKRAHAIDDDQVTLTYASLATGIVGVGAGIGAIVLWPRTTSSPDTGHRSAGFEVGLQGTW